MLLGWTFIRPMVILIVIVATVIGVLLGLGTAFGIVAEPTRQIAFMGSEDGMSFNIYMLDFETGLVNPVTQSNDRNRYPAWSPDGETLSFHSNRSFIADPSIVDSTLPPVSQPTSPGVGRPPTPSNTSRVVSTTGSYHIFSMSPDSSDIERLVLLDNPDFAERGLSAGNSMGVWSPDGSKIAFHSGYNDNDGTDPWNVVIYDLETDTYEIIFNSPTTNAFFDWHPDGTHGVFSAMEDGAFDLYTYHLHTGLINRLTNQNDNVRLLYDGMFYRNEDLLRPQSYIHPSYSPDGSRIAVQASLSGNTEIFVMNADGSDITNLTQDPGADGYPIWTPDGERIIFVSNRDAINSTVVSNGTTTTTSTGRTQLYIMDADGGNLQQLTDLPFVADAPAWRPR